MANIAMHDPVLIEMLADLYFAGTKTEETIPTVPGFALGIGFSRVADITQTLKDYEEGVSKYPKSCVKVILRALTQIEDNYLQNGLKNRFPAALVKFCLGTYHDRAEKVDPTQIAGNQNIQIVFETPKALDLAPKTTNTQMIQLQNQPVIEMIAEAE